MKSVSFIASGRAPLRLAASTVAVLLAWPALAQNPADNTLKEVVVVATRMEQPITDIVADVSIIDRDQIEHMGVTTVPEILARLPGMQSISGSDASRVYIRGADSRMTALYVDGVRVDSQDGFSTLGGGVPWELVPVSQIDRIEILRGPASAVYGSDAMGGVIQIFTRRGQSGMAPYVNAGLGSNNTHKVAAGLSGSTSDLDYAVDMGYERSDGFNTRPDIAHTPDRESYNKQSVNLRAGYQFSRMQRAEMTVLDSQVDSSYVPWNGGTDVNAKGTLSAAAIKWHSIWNDVYSTSLTLSHSKVAKQDGEPHDYKTVKDGILLENRWRVAGGNVTATLEQKHDSFDTIATVWGDPAFDGSRTQNAVSLGYGANLGLHAIQVNLRGDDDSIFGNHQTAAIAYGYSFAPKWRATVSAGTAFRAPTLEQIFSIYGSPQLKPESNRNHEIGIDYNNASSAFKAVVYRNAISDMISSSQTLNTCSAGYFCYYNVGQATIRGLTISGKRRFGAYDLNAAFDVLNPRDDVTGHVLSLRAKQVLSFGVTRQSADWLFGANAQAVGERYDDAANTVKLAGYGLVNLSATRKMARDWQLQLNVNNATNASYQQVGRYPAQDRNFYLGLKWEPRN